VSNHSRRVSRLVRLEMLNECLQWVLAHYSMERASWIVNRLTSHVQTSGATGIFVAATSISDGMVDSSTAIDRQSLCGVAIAIRQPGNSATLLALQVIGDATPDEVLAPLVEKLSQTGVTFIQSGCDDDWQGTMLASGGFEPLADLVMMSLEAEQFCDANKIVGHSDAEPATLNPVTWVELEQLGQDWRMHLDDIAAQTFIDTKDCPRLSDFRSAADIVQGYVEAVHFDHRLASLMRVGDQWAGCLILTAHPSEASVQATAGDATDHPSELGAVELTYMGLAPRYRGKGLSGHLLAKAIRQATSVGAARVVLAVDRDNHPAATIYRRLGWREVIGETVWGRKI